MIRRSLLLPILLGAAAAGIVGGHLLSYALVAPTASARHDLLAETGHGYLSKAVAVAVASAILTGVAAVVVGAARGRSRTGRPVGLRSLGGRLAALQVSGFLGLEVLERLSSGAPMGDLAGPLLVAGIPVQVAVASIAAVVLALINRTVAAVVRALTRPTSQARRRTRIPVSPVVVPPRAPAIHPSPVRGPPLLSAAD